MDEHTDRWMGGWMDGQTVNGWKERRVEGWILTRFNEAMGWATLDYFILLILLLKITRIKI